MKDKKQILIQELKNRELRRYIDLCYESATIFVTNEIDRMLWEEDAIGYHSSYKHRGGQLSYQELIDQVDGIYFATETNEDILLEDEERREVK